MGALGDGVRAAVVAVEQAVQGVHGGGAHDVAVLENAAHAGGIVEDIETRVAEVARDAELNAAAAARTSLQRLITASGRCVRSHAPIVAEGFDRRR